MRKLFTKLEKDSRRSKELNVNVLETNILRPLSPSNSDVLIAEAATGGGL